MIQILSKLFLKYKLLLSILVISVITNLFIVSKLYTYIENKKKSTTSEHFYSKYNSRYEHNYRKIICHIHKSDCKSKDYGSDYCKKSNHCHLIPYCDN